MSKLDSIDTIQPQTWTLPQLLSASIRASARRKENEQTAPSVSQETLSLLEKEVTAPPPVSIAYSSSADIHSLLTM